jgi:hypothetical protein
MIELLAPWMSRIDVNDRRLCIRRAALFWFSASIWKLSKKERAVIKYAGQDPIEGDLWEVAHLSAQQSRLNAIASVFAGLAALLSGVSALIGTRWG